LSHSKYIPVCVRITVRRFHSFRRITQNLIDEKDEQILNINAQIEDAEQRVQRIEHDGRHKIRELEDETVTLEHEIALANEGVSEISDVKTKHDQERTKKHRLPSGDRCAFARTEAMLGVAKQCDKRPRKVQAAADPMRALPKSSSMATA
jgi:TPP-dependent trihydroxycyclohexane-1,2-dione (THcHDO) dehydratase